jgi:phosphatidylinositol alpha-1,6-mannosyltransferase
MVTAGDDLPVAAILLLGMLFLHRRRSLAAGVMLGFAAGMKFIAWPLVLLALLVARDRDGNRVRGIAWLLGGMTIVLLPSVLPVFLHNPTAFMDNVVRYPLGLAKLASPAASALPGHLIVTAFPQLRRALPIALGVGGVFILGWVLVRHTPRTAADICRLGGWIMTIGIFFAPSTRVGYLLYPVNFFFWAWLLRSEEDAEVSLEAEKVVAGAHASIDVDAAVVAA